MYFVLYCVGKFFRPLGTYQKRFPLYKLQLNATVPAYIVCLSFYPVSDSPSAVFSDRMVFAGFTCPDVLEGDDLCGQWEETDREAVIAYLGH